MPYGADPSQYVARILTEYQLIRGRQNIITCPVYDGAELVVPLITDTISIYRASDTDDGGPTVVSSAALTSVAGGIASYTVPALTLPSTLSYGDGWRIVWDLTLGGVQQQVRASAALVRYALFPVVADADLYGRMKQLDPAVKQPLTSRTTFQTERDDAWTTIYNRIANAGNRPNLIMDSTATREAHITLTLANILRSNAMGNESLVALAEDFRQQYMAAWRDLRFRYDESESGGASTTDRQSAEGSVWLTSRG